MGMDTEALGASTAPSSKPKPRSGPAPKCGATSSLTPSAPEEGIEVTDEDVDEEIVRLARAQNMRASELYDKLRDSGQLRATGRPA